jgi:hypothetical protein
MCNLLRGRRVNVAYSLSTEGGWATRAFPRLSCSDSVSSTLAITSVQAPDSTKPRKSEALSNPRGNAALIRFTEKRGAISRGSMRRLHKITLLSFAILRARRPSPNFVARITAILILLALPVGSIAAEQIQQIVLGPYSFYVPYSWIQNGRVIAYAPPRTEYQSPQPTAIEGTDLSFRPAADWQPYGDRDLPSLISVRHSTRVGAKPPLDAQHEHWLAVAASSKSDENGFARVEPDVSQLARGATREIYIYKNYLNEIGEPLVVVSNNFDFPSGGRTPSSVLIDVRDDLGLRYDFDNRKFQEKQWWDLYQRVLAFLDYTQKPK